MKLNNTQQSGKLHQSGESKEVPSLLSAVYSQVLSLHLESLSQYTGAAVVNSSKRHTYSFPYILWKLLEKRFKTSTLYIKTLNPYFWIKIYFEEQEASLIITDCINSLNLWEPSHLFLVKDAFALDIKGSRIRF